MVVAEVSEGASSAAEVATPATAKLQYAIKTSLSLTLAYLIPMALGWPQPQTAATTVMLIAATGMMSESLQKGVSRILGTIAGAVIGLSLIALFPQDRIVYLLVVSCTVAVIIYFYNAYQGDSTVLMLTAVVTLMVFNGGDAEGAFLYGIDRAFMTAFGVIVYTVVASMLWPVKTANNTRSLAANLTATYQQAFDRLVRPEAEQDPARNEFLAKILTDRTAFETHYATVKNHADGVTDYLPEWNSLVSGYNDLETILLPALQQDSGRPVEFNRYLDNYYPVLAQVDSLFQAIDNAWRGQRNATRLQAMEIKFNREKLHGGSHLVAAAAIARAELLQKIQRVLLEILAALDSLLFDQGPFTADSRPEGKAVFIWLDGENLKTALRAFVTFWIATGIWITCNPPGGFMFVTLCTILIPLVSYTPVTPKLLFILFTLGFAFALPAYVFLLPKMTHWLELSVFLFSYAFIGFYVFQGPVSIFFLLGLFTLGIHNSMNYHVDAIMLTILMFYMICATLVISMYFPFSSKPERIYASLRRRFFSHCARRMRLIPEPPSIANNMVLTVLGSATPLLTKMTVWGAQINSSFLAGENSEHVSTLNSACELLHGQIQILAVRRTEFSDNQLIVAAQNNNNRDNAMAVICDKLAHLEAADEIDLLREGINNIEARLDDLLGEDYLERYDGKELAQFYLYTNLQASIFDAIEACRDAQQALDWRRLGETRF